MKKLLSLFRLNKMELSKVFDVTNEDLLLPLFQYISNNDLVKLMKVGCPGLRRLAARCYRQKTWVYSQAELDEVQEYFREPPGLAVARFMPNALDGISFLIPYSWGEQEWKVKVRALIEGLANNTTLEVLLMSDIKICADCVPILSKSIEANTTLTTLYLDYAGVDVAGANTIATSIARNTTLESLRLRNLQVGPEGARALAAGLSHGSLTSLDLPYNQLGRAGIRALGNSLLGSKLTKLDLSGNQITNKAVLPLAAALKDNATLASLTLCDNLIGNDGVLAFEASLVGRNTVLTYLNLSNNSFDSNVVASAIMAISRGREVRYGEELRYD